MAFHKPLLHVCVEIKDRFFGIQVCKKKQKRYCEVSLSGDDSVMVGLGGLGRG